MPAQLQRHTSGVSIHLFHAPAWGHLSRPLGEAATGRILGRVAATLASKGQVSATPTSRHSAIDKLEPGSEGFRAKDTQHGSPNAMQPVFGQQTLFGGQHTKSVGEIGQQIRGMGHLMVEQFGEAASGRATASATVMNKSPIPLHVACLLMLVTFKNLLFCITSSAARWCTRHL